MSVQSLTKRQKAEIYRLGRNTFSNWLYDVSPSGWYWNADHLQYIRRKLHKVTTGQCKRLMLFLPPRHGKSEMVTVRYAAWTLEKTPSKRVIIGAYNQTLANKFSRKARKIAAPRVALSSERTAVDDWETEAGGGLRAVGVGAGVAGMGGDCLVGGTGVLTDRGYISISDPNLLYSRCRVLAVDHESGRVEYRPIVAFKERDANELVEVTTKSGKRFTATASHLVYTVESGYKEAGLLSRGERIVTAGCLSSMRNEYREGQHDVLGVLPESAAQGSDPDLCVLQQEISTPSLRIREGHSQWRERFLLQARVHESAQQGEKRQAMQRVRHTHAGQTREKVLHAELQESVNRIGAEGKAAQANEGLPRVRASVSPEVNENGILRQGLRGPGPRQANARQGEFPLQNGNELFKMVRRDATPRTREGRSYVPYLQRPGTLVHSPHRRKPKQQQTRKSINALPELPYQAPQIEEDEIDMVRQVHGEGIKVYDIQVEGCNNFFAEGVLVHNCIIIDDPVKNREEANSTTYRDKLYDWYTDDLYTRQEPGASIILIQTRWHEDDLAGRILASEDGPSWTVVKLPALAVEGDPLGRETGDPLWPQRYDLDALNNFKVVLGRSFHALYQQDPQEQEGDFFKRSWFQFVTDVPAEGRRVRYWDKGASIDGDYTVGLLMCYADPYWYIEDIVRGQWTSHERNQRILQTAEMDGQDVKVYLEQEPGSSGVDSVQEIIRMLAGYSVHADKVTGAKGVRAEPFAAQAEAGNVKVKRARWNATYIDELTSFPVGSDDDQVDGSSGAFMQLVNTPPPAGEIINDIDMNVYKSKRRKSVWD